MDINKNQSVLLIGNGPSVFYRRHQDIVESFDHVVRFNHYEIDGYEKYIGTKTTIWCSHFMKVTQENIVPIGLSIHSGYPPPKTVDSVVCVGKKNLNFIKSITNPYYIGEEKNRPSTGLIIAIYFLEVIGTDKIHLLGFDHFDKYNSKLHHYWNNMSYSTPKEHSGSIEANILSQYERDGRVVYL